jgi:hypothetical protein
MAERTGNLQAGTKGSKHAQGMPASKCSHLRLHVVADIVREYA